MKEVAVKVQYPGLSEMLQADLVTVRNICRVTKRFFPETDLEWIVDELEENLSSELNFESEGNRADRVRSNFAHKSHQVSTPTIVWSATTKKILTMEFIRGVKVNDIEGLLAAKIDPLRVASLVIETLSEMIFIHGEVHLDPHPGNIFVVPGPKLVLLDHGLYRDLDEDFRINHCRLWKAVVMNNEKSMKEAATCLGVGRFYRVFPVLFAFRRWNSQRSFTTDITPAERKLIASDIQRVRFADIARFLGNMPRDLLLVFRTIDLVRSVNRVLGGTTSERLGIMLDYAVRGSYYHLDLPNLPHDRQTLPHIKSFLDRIRMIWELVVIQCSLFLLRLTT